MIIEILKLITAPIVITILGVLLLRRIESVKAEVAKHSDFSKKWADDFFSTCQEFMKHTERYMALLNQLQILNDPNNKTGTLYQRECTELNVHLSELELRIRRTVIFAPSASETTTTSAMNILRILSGMLEAKQGNFDVLFEQIVAFNEASKRAHAEMLSI